MNKYLLYIAAGILLGLNMVPFPVHAQSESVQAMVSSVTTTDARVTDAVVSSTSVSMTYPIKARLFGVFSLELTARVDIDSKGRSEVHYPWYAFLFSTDQAELHTKLEAVGKAASAWNTDTLNANQQLALLRLMHATLQSNLDAGSTTAGSLQ